MRPSVQNVWRVVRITWKIAGSILCFKTSVALGFVYLTLVLSGAALRKFPLAKYPARVPEDRRHMNAGIPGATP
jgi:hypothetical protein